MEVGFKTPPQENGAEKQEQVEIINEIDKTAPKDNAKNSKSHGRKTRSRSRTPQKSKNNKGEKNEEVKTLSVSLTKINENTSDDGHGVTIQKEEDKEDIQKQETTESTKIGAESEESKQEDNTKDNKENSNELSKNKEETISDNCQEGKMIRQANTKELGIITNVNGQREEGKTDKSGQIESKASKEGIKVEAETVEMDPLVLASDEPDPELQFDENSDMESGKGSPVLHRCKTRRSQTRNIPTPKTPKSIDSDSEKNSIAPTPDPIETDSEPKPENLNDTNDSIDVGDISTRVQVGSDITRLDYVEHHSSLLSDDSYLNASRERSLAETLRNLSSRKPIRQAGDNYRKRAFKNSQDKSDLNMPYPSLETVPHSLKRKGRSNTPEDSKKFKSDSSGLGSLLSSPLMNFREKFRSDLPSSTPKLTGYRDSNKDIHANMNFEEVKNGIVEDKKSWCSLM